MFLDLSSSFQCHQKLVYDEDYGHLFYYPPNEVGIGDQIADKLVKGLWKNCTKNMCLKRTDGEQKYDFITPRFSLGRANY